MKLTSIVVTLASLFQCTIGSGKDSVGKKFTEIQNEFNNLQKQLNSTTKHLAELKTTLDATDSVDHVILGEHTKNSEFDCNIYRGSNGEEIERECADRVNQYRVESYVIHPDFSETAFANDIGLIRLATDITWKYHIQPICLPVTPQLRVKQFKQYIVTGWGETEAGSEANELQEAILPQYSIAECQQRFSENDLGVTLGDKQICAGNVSRINICSGDYGGPLGQMTNYNGVRFVQYGIVVMALDACGDLNIPTVFTRVSNYMDWILENVK